MVMVALPSPLAVEDDVEDAQRDASGVLVAVASATVGEADADAAGDEDGDADLDERALLE